MTQTEIRQWVAANLNENYTPAQLREVLLGFGFPADAIEQELNFAAPYIDAAHKIKKTLNVREGLLKTLDYQMRELPDYIQPEKTPLPPFNQFLQDYYYTNRLGHFTSVLDGCEAKHWTLRNLVGKIGAGTMVEVQYDYDKDTEYRNAKNMKKYSKQMQFGDFIDKVETAEASNSFYLTGSNYEFNNSLFEPLRQDIRIGDGYLKFGTSDKDKRMFTLIGPAGTVTEAHYDFINNLFIQVYGRKLVRLAPAAQVPYMYEDRHRQHCVFDWLKPGKDMYPEFARATITEIELGPGEALFIPVGWWHHVTALTASISLACTNFNMPDDYTLNESKVFSWG